MLSLKIGESSNQPAIRPSLDSVQLEQLDVFGDHDEPYAHLQERAAKAAAAAAAGAGSNGITGDGSATAQKPRPAGSTGRPVGRPRRNLDAAQMTPHQVRVSTTLPK